MKKWIIALLILNAAANAQSTAIRSDRPGADPELNFLIRFRAGDGATGSGNGGDPLAASVVETARNVFQVCKIQTYLPDAAGNSLAVDLSLYRVRMVDFPICALEDSRPCTAESSAGEKVFRDDRLIIIDTDKWSNGSAYDRSRTATKAFLEAAGVDPAKTAELSEFGVRAHYELGERGQLVRRQICVPLISE